MYPKKLCKTQWGFLTVPLVPGRLLLLALDRLPYATPGMKDISLGTADGTLITSRYGILFSSSMYYCVGLGRSVWVAVGWRLSKVVVTFNHVGRSFNLFKYHHRGCLNNPIFLNLGLCAVCWAYFLCHHELWPVSTSHAFSSLNNSLGLAEGKYYPKFTIPIFRLVLQNFALPGCFPCILFCRFIFSLLSSGWFVIAVCGPISVTEPVK